MKKGALIIGCSDPDGSYLPGVKKDVNNYKEYLRSNFGGAWNDDEISVSLDQSELTLKVKLLLQKSKDLDFSLVVFSGHGSYCTIKRQRKLWINDSEFMYESCLKQLSSKELIIIDTCANKEIELYSSVLLEKSASLEGNAQHNRFYYRQKYNDALGKCADQRITLYSCDIDESSSDTSKGGLYSKSLLEAGISYKGSGIRTVIEAHLIAEEFVKLESMKEQNPQYMCNARKIEEFPFSVGI